MSNSDSTQLTPPGEYETSRMLFSEAISGSIPKSTPEIKFKRINILSRNPNGSIGDLIVPTQDLFSFGVTENLSQETSKVNGWVLPLCLWNRDGATKEEKKFTDTHQAIVERAIDHLVENREELEMFELRREDLTKSKGGLDPIYWKKEKHTNAAGRTVLRRVPGSGPTLYCKLIHSKKSGKFLSQFFDSNDEPIDPMTLMGKFSFVQAAIKYESIFIGANNRISLQIKLYEAVVRPAATGMKRLLGPPKSHSKVLEHKASVAGGPPLNEEDDDDEDDDGEDDDGSLQGDSSDDEVKVPDKTPSPKKVVRRVVKRVAKRAGR